MDPIKSFFGRLLLEEITPVVMVLSTPLAEQSCQKNGMSFVQMLRPYSLFDKIDVPVRTANDQPYRLQTFKLRLAYASDIRQQNHEAAEEHLKQVVSVESEKSLSDLLSDPPQLETVLSKSESEYWPSWIQTFNKELIQTISFSEHEAFDHPVACLLVVSSQDEQPINRFVDLFNTDQLPSLLNEGTMDPKILKNYLLLHDCQDETPEKAGSILAEMRSTFGPNDCKLLCINSSQGADDELKDNPWRSHPSLNKDSDSFLNLDDLNEIREFMLDLSSKHIIPHMEQKIRMLNQQVSITRRGFRNQLKNLWWRKGKEDAPETPYGPTYTFSSVESQIRVLADYAFMLRDYELALSNYRLLSTDYKLDKAWKRYAGVQEMMGLSYFMLDQSRKDSEYCMENAFSTYSKMGSSGQRNATRCGLWWAEMLKARGQHKDAATVYFRISTEEPYLHAAVMLEQASYCYLFSVPPMLRKYGFHLVLAGNRYYISNQRHHAIRAYRNALFVYKGNSWSYISNHVHFNIGRWYALLGIYDVAIKHMMEILACGHQTLATQNLFLTEFFGIVKNMGKTFEVCMLQLPVINMSSLKVVYEDQRTYASASAVDVSESLWNSLEEEMLPSVSTVRSNWLDSQSNISALKKLNDSQVCLLGEAIKLELEFKNPLQISISVSGVSLICELSGGSEATEIDRNASATGSSDDVELQEAPSCSCPSNGDSSVTLSELDFTLAGGETKRLQLHVTPRVKGVLKIVGVKWTLSGSVVGYRYFDFKTNKKQRKRKHGTRNSLSNLLNFIVIKGLPKLEGGIQHFPSKAYAGDLRPLTLEFRNQSEYAVKSMKMKISHPRFLIPGSLEDSFEDFPSCLEKQLDSDSTDAPPDTLETSKSFLFKFPNDLTIQGGKTLTWPLWFHGGCSGKISFYLSVYYEMENCSSDMSYRTLRMHYDLEILPSLSVAFLITPCPLRLQEFLVRMDIVNKTGSESLCLHQLSCVGEQWEILLLPTNASVDSSQTVSAGQALSCFFKLKDCRKNSNYESRSAIRRSNLLLGSPDSKDMSIDISRSPLVDFHHHEKYCKGKSREEGSSSVDFILISKMVGNEFNSEPGVSSQLLCNHICHCSITNKCPIWWLMDGPRTVFHDFSSSFCEVGLCLTIHNCSLTAVLVKFTTFDTMPEKKPSSSTVSDPSESQGGWHEVSLENDLKVLSIADGSRSTKLSSPSDSVSPFVWCASSSNQVTVEPSCSVEVPVRICAFSPGTYNLSNYELEWNLQSSDEGFTDDAKRWSGGTNKGHPFYLTILQSS